MKSAVAMQGNRLGFVQDTLLLILLVETVFFGTLVMAFLFLRTGGSDVPFTHPAKVDVMIAVLNTLMLLVSAGFAWKSHRVIREDDPTKLKMYLVLTLFFGAIFIFAQIFEFQHSGMKVDDSAFGGVFFALIGFHALHVLAGMTILALNTVRSVLGDFSARSHDAVLIGTWFWYYVAGVWLALFMVLYVV